ncbi:MAG: MlaD family protein, partial [Planctomycetota bacterium]
MPTRREVMVGLMFFASLATFFALALVLAGKTFQIGRQSQDIVVVFDDVSGIIRGTPVMLNGQEVGKVVEQIRKNESNKIEVTCEIDPDIQLSSNHRIEILSPLFGGATIAIFDTPGNNTTPVNMHDNLKGQSPVDPLKQFAGISVKNREIAETTSEFVKQINQTV